jgi:hypothetical protein
MMQKLKIGRWLMGFSGSPVFIQDYKTKKWQLMGILVSGLIPKKEKHKGGVLLVKPEHILYAINSSRLRTINFALLN